MRDLVRRLFRDAAEFRDRIELRLAARINLLLLAGLTFVLDEMLRDFCLDLDADFDTVLIVGWPIADLVEDRDFGGDSTGIKCSELLVP